MTQSNPYHEAASRGAALLDERNPGWWRRIDLDSLELDHCQRCVVGQIFGDYDDLEFALGDNAYRNRMRLGFSLGKAKRMPEWRQLTEAWKSIIRARLETDR